MNRSAVHLIIMVRNVKGQHVNSTVHFSPCLINNWMKLFIDGRIILRWVFRKWDVTARTGSIWFRIGTDSGHL